MKDINIILEVHPQNAMAVASLSCLNLFIIISNSHAFAPATGTKYHKSEPVYPTQNTDWEVILPDGTPVKNDKKPNYVFVWKTWGE